jgi:glycosyltransferase involved in cell wall biosynthesis
MKIAYLSVYRDGTGYGNSARDFIKCLSQQGADVVPVWFTLNSRPANIDKDIPIRNDLDGVDVVIQQTIPNSFVRIAGVRNIGLFYWESSSFKSSGWQYSCNLMDDIWMTTNDQIQAAKESGVKSILTEVTRPSDFTKYSVDYKAPPIPDEIKDTYKFYTISDYSYRKNIASTVTAFLSEFSARDNVSLIIKTYVDGKGPSESLGHIKEAISSVKSEIRRAEKDYPKIVIITDVLSDNEILGMHQHFDCYVTASRGEGECIPAFDAASFKKPVIATHWNGISKMFDLDYEPTVKSMIKKPVFAMSKTAIVPGLYSHNEWWMEGSLWEMMQKMRAAAEGKYKQVAINNYSKMVDKFSYETVGPKLMEALRTK